MSALIIVSKPSNKPGRFDCVFAGDVICTSRQPFFDGARRLSAMGFDDDTLVSCRVGSVKGVESFRSSLGCLRSKTVSEPDRGTIKITEWQANPRFQGAA